MYSQTKKETSDIINEEYVPVSRDNFTKALNKHGNHEVWHTCINCGKEFDLVINWDDCPKCKQVIK